MTWSFLDTKVVGGMIVPIGNADGRATNDFTWEGIRKGGKRWYRPFVSDVMFTIEEHTPPLTGPNRSVTWAQDPTKTQPRPSGITNMKKMFAFSMRSNNGTNNDWLQFNDYQGRFIRSVTWSDGVTNQNRQLVYLEKQLYVIAHPPAALNRLKVYDLNGVLISSRVLPTIAGFPAPAFIGITTDGKDLYFVWQLIAGVTANAVLRVDIQTLSQIAFYFSTAGTHFDRGISFNGRYFIVMVQANPPP